MRQPYHSLPTSGMYQTIPFLTLQQQCLWRLYNSINVLQLKEQDDKSGEEISCTVFCSGDLLSNKHCWKFLSLPNRWTIVLATFHVHESSAEKKIGKIKGGLYIKFWNKFFCRHSLASFITFSMTGVGFSSWFILGFWKFIWLNHYSENRLKSDYRN